jgi:hypothetical protein
MSKLSTIPGISQVDYDKAISERIKIPQFGDWQIDDKLQYVRDTATKIANVNGSPIGRVMVWSLA